MSVTCGAKPRSSMNFRQGKDKGMTDEARNLPCPSLIGPMKCRILRSCRRGERWTRS